jgi:integrase
MPVGARKLSHNFCRNVTEPGIYADTASPVRLVVRAGKRATTKTWDCRLTFDGKRTAPTIGRFPDMPLEEARLEANARKALARQGADPKQANQPDVKLHTFADCLTAFLADNPKAAADPQWSQHCRDYISPAIGDIPVADIALEHVLSVLRPIWTAKNETARRTQSKMKRVLGWAIAHRLREPYNPAVWDTNLSAVLPSKNEVVRVRHQSAVQIEDAPRFWSDLLNRRGAGVDALAFLILTVQRTSNILGARWEEISLHDDGKGRWNIPGSAMKNGKAHSVPLQPAAVAILRRQPGFDGGGGLVFHISRKGLSSNTLRQQMLKMSARDLTGFMDAEHSDRHAVPHGWRSTFRSWGANRGIEREALEKQLAHDIGSAVERAYQRADMIDRRLAIMEQWTAFLENGL